MTKVNLELQLKFLDQLEDALAEAMERYAEKGEARLSELTYMQQEVLRARRIVSDRIVDERPSRKSYTRDVEYQEAAL